MDIDEILALNTCASGVLICSTISFSILGDIPSTPGDLFILLILLATTSSSFTVPSGVMISRPCRTSYQSSPSSAIPCFPRDSLCAYRRPFCDVTAV